VGIAKLLIRDILQVGCPSSLPFTQPAVSED